MPHTGILAANPDGAATCFVTYCRAGAARLGGHLYPDVTLDYIAFGHSLLAWQAGDVATVTANLARSVDRLAAAGADFFVCPDNNVHLALDTMADLALPGLHIAEVVADTAHAAGVRRLGLLGSAFVLGSDLYPSRLEARGITAVTPEPEDIERLHGLVLGDLPDGRPSAASRAWCADLVLRLGDQGCDAVALVSTELSPLLPPEGSALPVIDSPVVLGRRALDVALGGAPWPTWRGGAAVSSR